MLPPGTSLGSGLTPEAAKELGLPSGIAVAASLIDAHAGGLGNLFFPAQHQLCGFSGQTEWYQETQNTSFCLHSKGQGLMIQGVIMKCLYIDRHLNRIRKLLIKNKIYKLLIS